VDVNPKNEGMLLGVSNDVKGVTVLVRIRRALDCSTITLKGSVQQTDSVEPASLSE
jgi:hypothetical protein